MAVKQLTGMDASYLYMETASSFGHVNSLSFYGRPADDPDFSPYDAFRRQVESRLHLLEPFRRRLVTVPFGIDHPYWINDPDFDLDFHIRHIALPPPGDDEQLGAQVARIIGRPMDRTRPLWEAYVFEGLASGDFAVLTKLHHATIDGAAGVEMMGMLLDSQPSEPGPPAIDTWQPDAPPSQLSLLNKAAVGMVVRPRKALGLGIRGIRGAARLTRSQGLGRLADGLARELPGPAGRAMNLVLGRRNNGEDQERDRPPLLPTRLAPSTPFNVVITPDRRFAFRSVPLADVKALKSALGVTLNDVVMATCAGALRRWLIDHDALPEQALIAGIPVSVRTGEEEDRWTNRVSMIFSELPTNREDPLARVMAVNATMTAAKEQFQILPADLLINISELLPPGLATRAARLSSRLRLADRVNLPLNLIVSNVPGPRSQLWLGKAPLKHFYPVSTVVDGQGLNMTVQSYLDTLDFGLVSCRELVPDLWTLVDYCVEELTILAQAAAEQAAAHAAAAEHAVAVEDAAVAAEGAAAVAESAAAEPAAAIDLREKKPAAPRRKRAGS